VIREDGAEIMARPCNVCHSLDTQRLDHTSGISSVDYVRCNACGHVWHVPKGDSGAVRTAVTRNRSSGRIRPASGAGPVRKPARPPVH
jgi:uncharacterized Zn finger protein